VRRSVLTISVLALTACGGGQPSSSVQPTALPKAISFSISRGSLVLNPKLATTVSLSDFQFQVMVDGVIAQIVPGNTASTTLTVPVTTTQPVYHLNLMGPKGYVLSQVCDGTSSVYGSVVCSGQIVDVRASCDDSISNYVYKSDVRLTLVNKCVAVIATLNEVSDSDEDDSDQEAHGVPDPRYASILTPGNASINNWLVLEAVCMGDIVKNPEATDTCAAFKANYPRTGPAKTLSMPARGSRVVVAGINVKDQRHSNWAEIHGISYIYPIPADAALADFAAVSTSTTNSLKAPGNR
jgi:hypothetical protein